jgi:hypothetical protein
MLQGPAPASGPSKGQPPESQASEHQQPSSQISGTTPAAVTPTAQGRRDNRANGGGGKPATDWWIFGLTAGLLLVAGFQAWLFLRQLRIMDDTLADTKKVADQTEASVLLAKATAESQLRAYMGFSPVNFNEIPRGQSVEFIADGTITNYGQTPAYDLVSVTRLLIGPSQIPNNNDLLALSDGRPVTGYFAPKQISTVFQPTLTIPRSEAQEVRAAAEKRLYYAGILSYRDALGTRWRFRFCYHVHWGRTTAFMATTEHNDERRE